MASLFSNLPTAPYNLTLTQESGTGLVNLMLNINTNLGDMFGLGILFSFFIIIFTLGLSKESNMAFSSASFLTFIISIYFARIGLVGTNWVTIFAAMALVSVIFLWNKKNSGGGY